MNTSRRFVGRVLVVGAILFGCAGSARAEKIRLGALYIGSSMLPLWIAQEDGELARRGLEVELIWLQSALSASR